MDLNIVWFGLFGILIMGYAVLDGFDLGAGVVSLFLHDDNDKRLVFNAIGPVWDGNEVWLLTAGGALFAAFPGAYATVFSGFYLALMLLLLALILRAVSFEFRGKLASPGWRKSWDLAFGLASLVPALLFGVAVGNILGGIGLDHAGNYTGTFFGLLNPYALVMGLLSVAMFVCHGSLYLAFKTDGNTAARAKSVFAVAWPVWAILFVGTTVFTFVAPPAWFAEAVGRRGVWLSFGLAVGAIGAARGLAQVGRTWQAFLASSVAIVGSVALVGTSIFPRLVPAAPDSSLSLTIYNVASTPRALTVMLVIALVGMPIVIGYTAFIYRVFKGEVVLGQDSY